MTTVKPIRFVVHAPGPYVHRSAGLRALYRLAYELQRLGHDVVVAQAFNMGSWAALRFDAVREQYPRGDVCPFDLELVSDASMRKPYHLDLSDDPNPRAVHVFSDSVRVKASTDAKLVRWLLNMRHFPTYQPELEVTWSPTYTNAPRLALDLIEHDLFYRKTVPGTGTVHYIGKRREYKPSDALGRELTWDWPATRAELADVLRGAELLVSFDTNTQINHEAALCGTPVVIPEYCGDRIWEPLFGESGIAYGWEQLDAARKRVESGAAQAEYELARQTIKDDVPRFVELVDRTFSRPSGRQG